ncbi:MAG: ribosome recycling factor [bacterium]
MQIINNLKIELDKTTEYLKNELKSLQVGRANPNLVENIEVEAYGQKMPLKQIAAIQIPEPRMIVIKPWDKSVIQNIERAINQSNLNINPIVEGDIVRLSIPTLSEERRRELVKIVGERIEECRINIRRHREDAWKDVCNMEQEGAISEDDKFKNKDELQKLVDEYNKKIDEIYNNKKEEILKV